MKRLYLKVWLGLFSCVVSLLLLEAILRIFSPAAAAQLNYSLFCKDPILRRIMRANARGLRLGEEWSNVEVAANSNGYRDTEWAAKKNSIRVMLLGDSFGWGWGCRFDKTISQVLERDRSFSVFNLSIPGDDVNDYYVRFNVYQHQIQPDVVVILAYVNDFFLDSIPSKDLERAKKSEALDPKRAYNPRCEAYPPRFEDYLDQIYLFRILYRYRLSGGLRFRYEDRLREALREGFADDLKYLTKGGSTKLDPAISWFERNLTRMKKVCPHILLSFIPPNYSIDPESKERLKWAVGPEFAKVQPQLLEKRLAALSEKIGLEHLNFRNALQKARKQVYIHIDGHLNEAGHEVVGSALHRKLLELTTHNNSSEMI